MAGIREQRQGTDPPAVEGLDRNEADVERDADGEGAAEVRRTVAMAAIGMRGRWHAGAEDLDILHDKPTRRDLQIALHAELADHHAGHNRDGQTQPQIQPRHLPAEHGEQQRQRHFIHHRRRNQKRESHPQRHAGREKANEQRHRRAGAKRRNDAKPRPDASGASGRARRLRCRQKESSWHRPRPTRRTQAPASPTEDDAAFCRCQSTHP